MNNTYMFLLLLGSYYGFLATLPIGPSKLLCVRNFLITTKGSERLSLRLESANSILIAGISGLILAQVIILLSIYSPSLYALWLKPHLFNLIIIPILLYYWHKIRLFETDTYNEQVLGTSNLYKNRIRTAFLETLFIQLLNPIVLPNAVYPRLTGVFLFRYSNIITFIAGICLGVVGGYAIFFLSTFYLVKRLEEDTPTLYRLVKRVIHQAFFPLFFIVCLISLGRAPIPSIKNFSFDIQSWQERGWPDILYRHDTWKRPLRWLRNNQTLSIDENTRAFNKMYFSQYFFEVYKKDGKAKLYHNASPSFALVTKDLNNLLQIPEISQQSEQTIWDEWIEEKENRKTQIENSIKNRLFSFEKGNLLEDIVEKKLGSIDYNGNILAKKYDPRLGIDTRGKDFLLQNISSFVLSESDIVDSTSILSLEKTQLLDLYTNNRLELFISENSKNLKSLPIISWQPEKDQEGKEEQNSYESSLNIEVLSKYPLSLEKLAILKKEKAQSWNNILSKIERSIKTIKDSKSQNTRLGAQDNSNIPDSSSRFLEIYKNIPLWNSPINKSDLEKPEETSPSSILANFARNLLPGSIRARRRKALTWNTYQNRPHAPLFLRAIDSLNLENALNADEENTFILFQRKNNEDKENAQMLKNRWNFHLAHVVRGIALFGQAYIRRYIKIPLLIIFKNLSRQLLLQPTEWQKDWTDLAQEVYIDCDYDGNDLYVGLTLNVIQAPAKQVKIVRPFRLRYWGKSNPEKYTGNFSSSNVAKLSTNELDTYSYLTIWGDETVEPFGKVKEYQPLWEPILQRIQLIMRHKIYKKYNRLVSKLDWINKYKEVLNVISKRTSNASILLEKNPDQREKAISSINKKETQNKDGVERAVETSKNILSSTVDRRENKKEVIAISNQTPLGQLNQEKGKIDKTPLLNEKLTNREERRDAKNLNTPSRNLLKKNDYVEGKIEKQTLGQEEKNIASQDTVKQLQTVDSISSDRIKEDLYRNRRVPILSKDKKVRKYTFRNNLIYIQRNLFHIQRSITQLRKNINYQINKKRIAIHRNLLKNIHKLLQGLKEISLSIRKFIINTNIWFSEIFNSSIFELKNFGKKSHNQSTAHEDISDAYGSTSNMNLSQAYVLHTIWQETEMNRPHVTDLLNTWTPESLLNKNLKFYLNKQGLLENAGPENIKYTHWDEWLKNLPGYRPSLKIWRHIVPQYWTQAVVEHWENISEPVTAGEKELYEYGDEKKGISNYLAYHTPLFEKAQKLNKLWKFYLLSRNYTHFANDGDVENFQTFDTHTGTQVVYNDQKKLDVDQYRDGRGIEKIIQNQSKNQSHTAYSKKDTLSRLIKSQAKDVQETPIQNDLLKELPIIQKEIKHLQSNFKLNRIRDRLSFPPIRENRWKSKELQNRFRNLIKAAKQRNVLKQSMLDKKHVIDIPHQMRKDLNIFYKNFPPEDVLFVSMLQNWRYKVLDDELLMYNIVSSFLRFAQQEANDLSIGDANKSEILKNSMDDISSLIPEELLLPKSLRELRILENLDLKASKDEYAEKNTSSRDSFHNERSDLNKKEQGAKNKGKKYKKTLNDKESIMRFLWPSHRIEDLACMNRFWLGTTNQSRFSALRIRPFLIN
jgi:Ycf1